MIVLVNYSTGYARLFLFAAALLMISGIANATDNSNYRVYSMFPANLQAFNNSSNISFGINYTSNFSNSMFCMLNISGAIYDTINISTMNTTYRINLTNLTTDGTYTWYLNCSNLSTPSNSNSTSVRTFYIDSVGPFINFSNVSDPDTFYSRLSPQDAIHFNVTLNATGSNITSIMANLTNSSNGSIVSVIMNYSATLANGMVVWNATINVTGHISELITNGVINANSPVAVYTLVFYNITDSANNSGTDGYDPATPLLLHDLGGFQGPPASMNMSTCFREGTGTTNMSSVSNFNAVYLVQVAEMNGSATCAARMAGMSQAMPWGDNFKRMAMFNFTAVDMSTQEKASAVMGAMGNLISVNIMPPRTFGYSRIYVNTSSLLALNVSANITLFDLPFGMTPGVTGDAGTGSFLTNWSQGPYNTSFYSMIGNLTIYASGFSGYNVSDNVTTTMTINTPPTMLNTSNTTNPLPINITANGTGSEVSIVYINVTLGGADYGSYVYNNVTGVNTASCYNITTNSTQDMSCQVNLTSMTDGNYIAYITVRDYGGVTGNSNTWQANFTIDTVAPVIGPLVPANNTIIANRNMSFTWTVYDATLPANQTCNFSLDSTVNRSNIKPANNTPFTVWRNDSANFTEGSHSWSINCTDSANNSRYSGLYFFTVLNATQGNETNISSTGLGTVNATINGSIVEQNVQYNGTLPVNITGAGLPVVSFNYDFNYVLNFSNISIINGTSSVVSGASFLAVSGINASGGLNGTKTLIIRGSSSDFNGVCIKNQESVTDAGMSAACTGTNEIKLRCNGVADNGRTCTASGTTLVITGLAYTGVRQYDFVDQHLETSSTGSSNSGGGSTGGSGAPPTSQYETSASVDIGGGISCTVGIKREISSSNASSVVTTTLANTGGSGCTMTDFVFADTIPDTFAGVNDISFSPAYSSREGWTVSFSFPSFAGGESKVITYTVASWVAPSKVNDFTTYAMSAKKSEAAPAPVTEQPTSEGTATEQPAATGTQPPAGSEQAPAQSPASEQPAPSQGAGILGALFSTGGILVGIVVVLAAVYFLFLRKKRRGL